MKKLGRKYLALIISLIMLFQFVPLSVLSEEEVAIDQSESRTLEELMAPEETAEPEEVEFWEEVISKHIDDYTVTVTVTKEAEFPVGTTVTINPLNSNDYRNEAATLFDRKDNELGSFIRAFDITFWYDGMEIEPLVPVDVKVIFDNAVELEGNNELKLIHLHEDEAAKEIEAETETAETEEASAIESLSFQSDKFSTYIVAEEVVVYTFSESGNNYEVVLKCNSAMGIPQDAVFTVEEITKDSDLYDPYAAQVAAVINPEGGVRMPALLDISLKTADGEKIQLDNKVKVIVRLTGEDVQRGLQVVHFPGEDPFQGVSAVRDAVESGYNNDEIEILDIASERLYPRLNTKENTVTFNTNSFSVFALAYTVDFEYDGARFSINGGSGIYLSELLPELGISSVQLADIKNVVFSNPSLVQVSQVENENGEPDWLLKSLQPFKTNETLKIMLADSRGVLTISVTDDNLSLSEFITNAQLTIDSTTYGMNDEWVVYPEVDYDLKLTFSEKGSRQFPGGGSTISMPLPAGIEIDDGTECTFDIVAGLAGTVTGNRCYIQDGKICITFGSDPYDILTRSSNVHFDLLFPVRFLTSQTKVTFKDGVEANVEVKNEAEVSVRKTGRYNPETGKMDYTVTVSSQGNSENVEVTDTIYGSALTLDQNSIQVSKDGYAVNEKTDKGFKLTIGEIKNGETVTINYSANVDLSYVGKDFKIINASENGKNSVDVKNDDNKTDHQDYTYTNEIRYSNITKVNTATTDGTGSDEGKKILDWKIVVNNPPLKSIVGGTITDTIDYNSGNAMKYLKNSSGRVALTVVAKDAGGNVVQTLSSESAAVSENGPQESWNWIIPQINSEDEVLSYEITYQTVVDPAEIPDYHNGFVYNAVSNDYGGNSGGSSYIGDGGSTPGDEITAAKTATTATSEYIDWNIVVVIPEGGFPDGLKIVDDLPWQYEAGADTLVGEPVITGLTSPETYTWTLTQSDDKYLKRDGEPVLRSILTIDFFEDAEMENPGLGAGPRTLTVSIRTRNDQEWVKIAGENSYYATHTNNARVNNYAVSASAKTVPSKVKKTLSYSKTADQTGDGLPVYGYDILLSNVTSVPVVLDDYFDTHLAFADADVLDNMNSLVYAAGDCNNYDFQNSSYNMQWGELDYSREKQDSNSKYYVPDFSIPDEGHLHITVNSLPTKQDGSYYPYYHVRYEMKVKDADALQELKDEAILNKGVAKIGNSVLWDDLSDSIDVEYKVKGIDKDGWARTDCNSSGNARLYDFFVDINPGAVTLNEGNPLEMHDTHSANLSVDYHSIKAYKLSGNVSTDTFKNAVKTALASDGGLANLVLPAGVQETRDISWDFNGNIGTFSGIQDNTHYVIFYSALILGNGNQSFSNEAEMEGFITSKSGSKNCDVSASGAATVLQIGLLKYTSDLTSEGLEGAKFQLFRGPDKLPMTYGDTQWTRDHNLVGKNITFTTGDDGYVKIALNQSEHGAELEEDVQYWLKEVESPSGFKVDSSVEYWAFTLTMDAAAVNYGGIVNGERQWIYFGYDDIIKISNTPTNLPLTVQVDKSWIGLDGNAIADTSELTATFQLYQRVNNGDFTAVDTITNADETPQTYQGQVTLQNGTGWSYTWENLPRVNADGSEKYSYKVEEVGITCPENQIFASSISEIENDTQKIYTVTNYRIESQYVNLEVKKSWVGKDGVTPIDDENVPESVKFYLYCIVSAAPITGTHSSGGMKWDAPPQYDTHKVAAPDEDTGLYVLNKSEYSGLTFEDLPSVVIDKNTGVPSFYAYYVKEVLTEGYSAGIEITSDTSGDTTTTIFSITNTKLPDPVELTVSKK